MCAPPLLLMFRSSLSVTDEVISQGTFFQPVPLLAFNQKTDFCRASPPSLWKQCCRGLRWGSSSSLGMPQGEPSGALLKLRQGGLRTVLQPVHLTNVALRPTRWRKCCFFPVKPRTSSLTRTQLGERIADSSLQLLVFQLLWVWG